MSYIDPPSKLLKHVDRIADIYNAELTPPVNIEIDLSNRCSLGCAGCHFAYTHTRGPLATKGANCGDLIDTALAKSVLNQLQAAGVRSVTFSGGGEPTLHPDFEKIVSACKLPMGIYTNGTQMSEGRAAFLKGHMTWVYISLDYAEANTYKHHKRVGSFDKVIEGVKLLVAAHGDATIGLGFLLWKANWSQHEQMVALGRELGVDYVQFRPMIWYDQQAPSKLTEDTGWMTKMIAELEKYKGDKFVIADTNRFKIYQNWKGHGYPICYWSLMQTVITPDGRLWTCLNRRGMEGDCIGDLKQEAFMDIWRRVTPKRVDKDCRVSCRGHIPNLTLAQVMQPPEGHENFI